MRADMSKVIVERPGHRWKSGEISANIDRRNTVQQHIYQHIDGFIAIQVEIRGGELDEVWYRVGVEALPAEPRHDVVLHRQLSYAKLDDRKKCERLYGSSALYAVSKRQLSRREIKAHRLR